MPLNSRSYGQSRVGRRPPWVGGLTHARRGGRKPTVCVFFGRQVTKPGFSWFQHFVVLFHLLISFRCLAFRDFSLLRTHFWPFTEILRKIRPEVTRKSCSRLRTIWIADAHREGKRFVVRADKKLTAFLELESAIAD